MTHHYPAPPPAPARQRAEEAAKAVYASGQGGSPPDYVDVASDVWAAGVRDVLADLQAGFIVTAEVKLTRLLGDDAR